MRTIDATAVAIEPPVPPAAAVPAFRLRYCAFCGCSQLDAPHMIENAAETAAICDACIDGAAALLAGARARQAEPNPTPPPAL